MRKYSIRKSTTSLQRERISKELHNLEKDTKIKDKTLPFLEEQSRKTRITLALLFFRTIEVAKLTPQDVERLKAIKSWCQNPSQVDILNEILNKLPKRS